MKNQILLLLIVIINNSLIAQGNCLHFDGSNDYVEVSNSPLTGNSDYTVECWFRTEIAGTESYNRLVGWASFELDIAMKFDELWFYDGSFWNNSNTDVNDGNWHHVAVTRSGDNFKMFIDGTEVLNFTKTLNLNFTGLLFRIGGKGVGGNASFTLWKGEIDEFRIWNNALTQTEIQNINNCELVGSESCLVAYYNFNQGTAGGDNSGLTTLDDIHSNNNDGTLTNFSLSGSTSNWITSGAGISGNCSSAICSALPVELINFHGKSTDKEIELTWTTASELNNLGFEIQKSNDGRNWMVIDFIEGRGTTSEVNEYDYIDTSPFSGINFFRLKQIDYDGVFEYSKVIAIEYNISDENIQVFPNPSNRLINIQIANPLAQRMKIRISNNLGREIWESELIEGESNWRKEMEIEENGIYFILTQIGDEIHYKRVIILDEK